MCKWITVVALKQAMVQQRLESRELQLLLSDDVLNAGHAVALCIALSHFMLERNSEQARG